MLFCRMDNVCSQLLLHSCISVPEQKSEVKREKKQKERISSRVPLALQLRNARLLEHFHCDLIRLVKTGNLISARKPVNMLASQIWLHSINMLYHLCLSLWWFRSTKSRNAINMILISWLDDGIFPVCWVQAMTVKHIPFFSRYDAERCTLCVWQTSSL